MKNVYLIYGEEKYLIDEFVMQVINKYSEYEKIEYDALENNIDDVINDLNMGSLFSNNKIIIVSNCYFLTGSKSDIEHNTDALIDYFKNDNDNILILILNEEAIDKRKKVVKELENKADIKVFNKLNEKDTLNFIKNYSEKNGYKIDDQSSRLFLEYTRDNLYIITNELDKMFLYKDNNKTINKEDVKLITSRTINANIFDLIEAITKRDVNKSLFLYQDLVLLNEEEIKLIIILANQFRLIYQVKEMYKEGYSEYDISRNLNVHPYRVKLAYNMDITINESLEYIKKLSELDRNIKSGVIDKKYAFEKFIIELK